jgi:cytochrome c oxidase cbb3-type subunit 4
MNLYSMISVAATVLTFLSFLGIVAWAYSARRKVAFDRAADAPFALPDEAQLPTRSGEDTGRTS